MKIYLRKIDHQCIEKQISFTVEIREDFFDNKGDHETISVEGKNSGSSANVEILLSTDPRFGAGIKEILRNEGCFEEGNLMIMYKYPSKYVATIIQQDDEKYQQICSLFDDVQQRHIVLNIDDRDALDIANSMNNSNSKHGLNRILYGAPGTGKTYSTAVHAVAVIENNETELYKDIDRRTIMQKFNSYLESGQVVFTTFHQNYGYEDFVQGIRPIINSQDIRFEMKDGIFKKLADEADKYPEKNYVLVIDEINRANISKVFGELITLIEPDKRKGEINALKAKLPSGEYFEVPNNLYIIGTMNSADKSISLVDSALRRRFIFIEMPPMQELITDRTLNSLFLKLNTRLRENLGSSDLLVGHAYFVGKTENDAKDIFNDSVIPLLYEYYFGNEDDVFNTLIHVFEGYSQFHVTRYNSGKTIRRIRIET